MHYRLIILLALVLMTQTVCSAQATGTASTTDGAPIELPIERESQNLEYWCWAASSNMILKNYGINYTQYTSSLTICYV